MLRLCLACRGPGPFRGEHLPEDTAPHSPHGLPAEPRRAAPPHPADQDTAARRWQSQGLSHLSPFSLRAAIQRVIWVGQDLGFVFQKEHMATTEPPRSKQRQCELMSVLPRTLPMGQAWAALGGKASLLALSTSSLKDTLEASRDCASVNFHPPTLQFRQI